MKFLLTELNLDGAEIALHLAGLPMQTCRERSRRGQSEGLLVGEQHPSWRRGCRDHRWRGSTRPWGVPQTELELETMEITYMSGWAQWRSLPELDGEKEGKDDELTGSSWAWSERPGMTTVAGFRRRAMRKKSTIGRLEGVLAGFTGRGRSWRRGGASGGFGLVAGALKRRRVVDHGGGGLRFPF
jgi:hypothetical protein